MLNAIRRLISEVAGDPRAHHDAADETQLAVAALLFHLVAVDGVVTAEEQDTLKRLLAGRFDLDNAATEALLTAGERADEEAVDFYGFTSLLKSRLSEGQRERIIEMMWRLVYADGSVGEFEDNMVWRVAELLAVPTQTRIRLKQMVRDDAG